MEINTLYEFKKYFPLQTWQKYGVIYIKYIKLSLHISAVKYSWTFIHVTDL
jgi:hypothetical protein